MKRIISICATVLMLCGCFTVYATAADDTEEVSKTEKYPQAPTYSDRYWVKDLSFTSENGLPINYRTMTDEFGSHKMPKPTANPSNDEEKPNLIDAAKEKLEDVKTKLEELNPPSREGMDTLYISGSGEYSVDSFKTMIEDIRCRTDNEICVFDLRQETHGFVNAMSVSLYADGNTGNVGLNSEEVLELEKEQLGELLGTELTLKSNHHSKSGDSSTTETVIDVDEVLTEQKLCQSENVKYVRLSCTDHLCPDDSAVDEFMEAYLALPEGTWLHFHCAAGVGRTGLFMMMADMLRNPDVSLNNIIYRQVLLGANDPHNSNGPEGEESGAKMDLLQRFYDYVQEEESIGFPDTFTEWNKR